MTTDIIEIDDFIVLIDKTDAQEAELFQCQFDDHIVGISFYGSGHVDIEVRYGNELQTLKSRKGMALSFYGDQGVRFSHKISQSAPLHSVSVFITLRNLKKQSSQENALYLHHLKPLLNSNKSFEIGHQILMIPEMHQAVSKIFETPLQNFARALFLKSQVLELLSHYFGQIELDSRSEINPDEIKKIHQAKEILVENMNHPPSLNELSKLIGINSNKLKRNFKQIFGVPVFKYLQTQRLQRAYQLLNGKEMTVQEVAWFIGYESVSSFSNAFYKQYGCRPSEVLK